MQGPNVRRLIATRIGYLAIPNDSPNHPLADGVGLFTEPGKLARLAEQATREVMDGIGKAREALKKDTASALDDESVAEKILETLDQIVAARAAGRKSS